MSFIPNGVKYLKRHSFANISEALRGHAFGNSRRDSLNNFLYPRSFSPGRSSNPSKNAHFDSITDAVVQLFQKRHLQEGELHAIQENVRHLMETDAGPLIYDYYKEQIMKKGMMILREGVKNESGARLLQKLGEQWDYFYQEILPILQALLFPVKTKGTSIRDVTLLGFRNIVVLKIPFSEALNSLETGVTVNPNIEQMLLVLQSVKELPLTENYVKLEKLLARVVSPYLGVMGFYTGSEEPEFRSNVKQPPKIRIIESPDPSPTEEEVPFPPDPRSRRHRLSPLTLPSRPSLTKLSVGIFNHHLSTVKEQDVGRRHSIDAT